MRMVSAKLKMITFKTPITVSVMTMSRSDRDMDAWKVVLYNRLCCFWSLSKGNRKISTRQPYTMDHYKFKRFYKKRHCKDKQVCEGIGLFSSYFSGSSKVKDSW